VQVIYLFNGRYDFLSNFFTDQNGFCVEKHYQAAKATNANDHNRILNLKTPNEAKQMGGKIQLRPDWEQINPQTGQLIKIDVMENLIEIKFSTLVMKQMLLSTGNALLIEMTWWHDIFFGVCSGEGKVRKCNGIHPPFGQNYLGRILMKRRAILNGSWSESRVL
jgi:ribA/ribD-fused uncharacterized protein